MASSNLTIRILVLLGLLAGLAAIQVFLRVPETTLFWEAAYDSGHGVLYGLCSWVVLVLLDTVRPTGRRVRRYFEVFAVTVVAGAAMEALQYLGPRQPQVGDLLRNAEGSAAFLALAASFDPSVVAGSTRRRVGMRIGLWIAAVGALGIAFLPVILAGGATVARDRAFPRLCGFDTIWERQHVLVENAGLEFRRSPAADRWDSAGFVTFRPGRYSLVALYDPYPDWTGYETLRFTVYSELDEAVTVTLWIADEQHVAGNWGSFRRRLRIEPGEHRFDVPVSEILKTDRERELDLTRIHKVVLYASRVTRPFSLLIDDFRLE